MFLGAGLKHLRNVCFSPVMGKDLRPGGAAYSPCSGVTPRPSLPKALRFCLPPRQLIKIMFTKLFVIAAASDSMLWVPRR
jgi:hypothetical protein